MAPWCTQHPAVYTLVDPADTLRLILLIFKVIPRISEEKANGTISAICFFSVFFCYCFFCVFLVIFFVVVVS